MEKISVWKKDSNAIQFSKKLSENFEIDVAIIGGGITGLTSAYFLNKVGKSVAIFEANEVGSGTTGYSTGNLYAVVEEPLQKLITKFGAGTVREVIESRLAAIQQIETLIQECSINCDFRKVSWNFVAESEDNDNLVQHEYDACFKMDLKARIDSKTALPFNISKAVCIDNQAQFNPMLYVQGLSAYLSKIGTDIFEHTSVTEIKEGTPNILQTTRGLVKAKTVIHATHTPKGFVPFIQTMLGPYREYAVAGTLNSGEYPQGIFWVVHNSNHYSIRTYTHRNGEKNILLLGEPHKVGQKKNNSECRLNLEAYLRSHFDIKSIDYKWSGQNYKSADGLPYIGLIHDKHNIFIGTGYGTDGLTYGTLAAIIISDKILGKSNAWEKLYDPHRHNPAKAAGRFIKENANVLEQYVKDLPFLAEAKDVMEIKRGEGKTVEIHGRKCAVYRDQKGSLHEVSAICTHLKCTVHWNQEEDSWDCPCHGSRFTIEGSVIEGPALTDLKKYPP
ncbi:MAG: FAD-dependent oxidoreductase [Bdellovibrio sp.]